MTHEQAIEYIMFLDDLRASGRTNMFGAGPYLRDEFGLTVGESYKILAAWMEMDRQKPAQERALTLTGGMGGTAT